MKNISLQSIKWESVRSIFTMLAERPAVSRAELSEETGLSLVTVGKVADALLDMNIVRQVKETKPHAGRRAGILSLNDGCYSVILNLSSSDFFAIVMNLRLQLMEKITYAYDATLTYEENLPAFFRAVSIAITEGYELENCYGIGISVPGVYRRETDTVASVKKPELNRIHLRELLEQYFGGLPICIDAGVSAAALSNISKLPSHEEKNILYWFVGSSGSYGALVVKGEVLPGMDNRFCDLGNVRDASGKSLSMKLSDASSPAEFARILALDTANLIRILAPHMIILECDRRDIPEEEQAGLISALVEIIKTDHGISDGVLPEFIGTGHIICHAHRGIAMKLRELWIRRLIEST